MGKLVDQYKLNETDADRARQTEIFLAFCKALKVSGIQSPDQAPQDAVIIAPDLSWRKNAEIKFRNHAFGTFQTYTIDRTKLDEITAGETSFLIVSWCGDIRYAEIENPERFKVTRQKRRDRDELPDEVYHVPLDLFKKVA